jgi:HD superfamily phosphohydrolase
MKLLDPVISKEPIIITQNFWKQTISHPNLTRLKYINQVGNIDHIQLASNQNRYAHSLGTGYRISQMLPERIEKGDREKAIFAGLCHDLGHGPYSHSLEHFILPGLGIKKWRHEELSVLFARQIYDSLEDPSFSFTHFDEILHSGTGDSPNDVFQLVSSKTTGFDCDRFDYLIRDSWHIGQSLDVNWAKLMGGIEFRPETMGKKYCQVLTKDAVAELARFLTARYSMFDTLYQCPDTLGVEMLVADIFLEANQFSRFSERIQDPEYFLEVDDSILRKFRKYKKKSKRFSDIYERLERRQFYSHAGTINLSCPQLWTMGKEEREARMDRVHQEVVALVEPLVARESVGFINLDIDESKDVNLARTVYQSEDSNPASLQYVAENAQLTALFTGRKTFKIEVFARNPADTELVAQAVNKWVQKCSETGKWHNS